MGSGHYNQDSNLCGKHFTNWTISSAFLSENVVCVGGCVYMYKSFFPIFLFLSVIAVFSGAFQILNVANKKKPLSLNEINI